MHPQTKSRILAVVCGTAVFCGIVAGLASQPQRCEDPRFERGDTVVHRITGERAIIGASFCSGNGEARKRMYEVSTGDAGGPRFWGQYEVNSN